MERPYRVGVLGTLVWDTIYERHGREAPVAEWGGIAYGIGAAAAALPDGWVLVPIVPIGRDLSEAAFRFLREIPGLDCETGVRVVPYANNRVELRYVDGGRRTERLTGGVPSWGWPELTPIVRTCDALYVNFISGFELDLDTARMLRDGYAGPTYADLHSLFQGVGNRGLRVPQELPRWREWLRCFDAVQTNEEEFDLLGRAWGDPWRLAAEVVGAELKLVAVTLGDRGAAYVAAPAFDGRPQSWPPTRHRVGVSGPSRSGHLPVSGGIRDGDPTGCGDVWGATFFVRLLAGDGLETAMGQANTAAARNVGHHGATGLHRHLQGRLADR